MPPISLVKTFQQCSAGCATAPSDPNSLGRSYEYSSIGNPTRSVFEQAVAAAEKAHYFVAFSSVCASDEQKFLKVDNSSMHMIYLKIITISFILIEIIFLLFFILVLDVVWTVEQEIFMLL